MTSNGTRCGSIEVASEVRQRPSTSILSRVRMMIDAIGSSERSREIIESCRRGRRDLPEALLADDGKSLAIMTIYCVLPTYRARTTVAAVVAEALDYAQVVVVVDDGCPEGSGDAVQAAYPDSKRVRVLRHERNRG